MADRRIPVSGLLRPQRAPGHSGARCRSRARIRTGPGGGPLIADRGIGGTGIETGVFGVITGFASICVGGSEVAYGPATTVLLDGQSAGAGAMRAGQLAAVNAVGRARGLRAIRVLIRHEVVGPVQAVEPGGILVVAGQRVRMTPATLGTVPAPGDWVAVSGFPDFAGMIEATRIDREKPGSALVSGAAVRDGGQFRIGLAEIRPTAGGP